METENDIIKNQPDGQVQYDDTNIVTLTGLEHIRLRPGMYIGKLDDGSKPDDGIYVLLKEVFDNSIDEFKMKAGDRIEVTIEDNLRVTVRDYGRGIPQGKLIDSVSILNTSGKFDSKAFKKSIGLNGVGVKAVNALSSRFEVRSYRDGKVRKAIFKCGKLISDVTEPTQDENGTSRSSLPRRRAWTRTNAATSSRMRKHARQRSRASSRAATSSPARRRSSSRWARAKKLRRLSTSI